MIGVEADLSSDQKNRKGQVIVCHEIISTLKLCLSKYYPETTK